MEHTIQKTNIPTSSRNLFLRGMLRSNLVFNWIFVPAYIFRVLFIMGLEGEPLIATLLVIIISLLLHPMLKTRWKTRFGLFWGFAFLSSILCGLAALLALFTFDSNNVPTVIVLAGLLFSSYFMGQLELSMGLGAYPESSQFYLSGTPKVSETPQSKFKILNIIIYWLGFSALPLGVYLAQSILPQIYSLPFYLDTSTNTIMDSSGLIVAALSYLVFPLVALPLLRKGEHIDNDPTKSTQTTPSFSLLKTRIQMIFAVFLVILLSALYLYAVLVVGSPYGTYCFVGICIGALLGFVLLQFGKQTSQLWSFIPEFVASLCVILVGVWFLSEPTIVNDIRFMIFLGFNLGLVIALFNSYFSILTKATTKHTYIWGMWLLLLLAGSGFLAGQLRWLVRDLTEWLEPAQNILIFTLLGLFLVSSSLVLMINRRGGSHESKHTQAFSGIREFSWKTILSEKLRPSTILKEKRTIQVVALAILILVPSLLFSLHADSRTEVTIQLPQTMYTVDGEALTELTLSARSAKVLLYYNPTDPIATQAAMDAVSGSEPIRAGKTIRLGAYLYGGTENLTSAEAVDWVGNHLDVFSLGGWPGGFFVPDDILTIRALNPATKFYIMTFATTFYSDPQNPDCECLNNTNAWGCTFNDTMSEWTLKANDGSEIYGVRRGPGNDNVKLMDLGQLGWADFYAWFYEQRAEAFYADGVAIDEVMWQGYWGTNVGQLRDYDTVDEITESCYRWLERIDEKMDVEIMTQAYWEEAQEYQQAIWGELSFRSGGAYGGRADDRQQTIFYEGMDWEGIVNNMQTMVSRNKSYIWAAWYNRTDPEALEYAIGTYLMGKPNNSTLLGFHPQPVYDGGYPINLAGYDMSTVRDEVAAHPEFFDLELGVASNLMYLEDGVGGQVYRRDFENGIVFVNPFHAQVPGFQSNDPVWAPSH